MEDYLKKTCNNMYAVHFKNLLALPSRKFMKNLKATVGQEPSTGSLQK